MVCMRILNEGMNIDPDGMFGGLSILLMLDTYNIYGPRIWMLYKDVCGQDIVKTIAALRVCQMGLFPIEKLQHTIDSYGEGVDPDELLTMVKNRLPNFNDPIKVVARQ